MNRNTRSLSENKLDDEFPPLSSLSKPTSNVQFSSSVLQQSGSMNSPLAKSSSAGIYSPKKQKATISLSTAEQFAAFDIKGPESFLQTEFSPQDFNHALSSSFNYIPDTPYDANESDLYSQTGINTGNANSTTDLQNTENLQIHYPASRNMKLLQPESLRKYDLSTLFFIFFLFETEGDLGGDFELNFGESINSWDDDKLLFGYLGLESMYNLFISFICTKLPAMTRMGSIIGSFWLKSPCNK